MLSTLSTTVIESLRYRGRLGHYSWLAHRLSGLGILFFLVIHVWDGANLYYAPHWWEWAINLFKNPLLGIGEIAIFGAVIYHAFNGVRITLLDFKPEWWHLQNKSAVIVWVLFAIIFIPVAISLFMGVIHHCADPMWTIKGMKVASDSCWAFPPSIDQFK